jgi:hypothetical protein
MSSPDESLELFRKVDELLQQDKVEEAIALAQTITISHSSRSGESWSIYAKVHDILLRLEAASAARKK